MSERRRRYRKPKQEEKRPITIARRQTDDLPRSSESEIQPKILLKPKQEDEPIESEASQLLQRTAISANIRNEPTTSSQTKTTRILTKDRERTLIQQELAQQEAETVPMMTRPATILSSIGVVATYAKKLLKENTDFFVVGVIGTQGVGKSTILNLLANEDCDYYRKVFVDEDGYFPTKLKHHKFPSRSRTESTHMFITPDRMILLDGAPVMCNSYKKDMTTNELDDLRSIVNFLSVCHLVIVVYSDFLDINFVRLIRLAELMKPSQSGNGVLEDYFPSLLFVKNRAKRRDFSPAALKQNNEMIQAFFQDSKMRIHRVPPEQSDQKFPIFRKDFNSENSKLSVNSFMFPEVKGLDAVPYLKPLNEIIEDLRWLVFTTPRNKMSSNDAEFAETAWFDLFEKVTQTKQNFFFNTYNEIHRSHLDVASGTNVHGGTREIDSWKD